MPIRSPRLIYEIIKIVENKDDNPDGIDVAPVETVGGLQEPIFAKIKKGIGDYLGLKSIPFNDPIFKGYFDGSGTNYGSEYRRNIGGFRVASYKFIAKSYFNIEEEYYDKEIKRYVVGKADFRTMSIRLPKGHSVNEVIQWALSFDNLENIAAMVTPKGRRIDMINIIN